MKVRRIIGFVITVIVLIVIFSFVYKVFIGCSKTVSHFDNEFTLVSIYDYAVIDSEVRVKLMGIEDDRCLDSNCEREGEIVAKLLVISNHTMSYIELGTLADSTIDIDKTGMGYTVELIDINEDMEVTLKVTVMEE